MAKISSSTAGYALDCSSCGHEWYVTAEEPADNCPSCGAALEMSSGHFRVEDASKPATERPSGSWGWAEATQSKV
jgi:predicted RNA-binding Zn-ribbon protein involved in translation (DUF1610 family)